MHILFFAWVCYYVNNYLGRSEYNNGNIDSKAEHYFKMLKTKVCNGWKL